MSAKVALTIKEEAAKGIVALPKHPRTSVCLKHGIFDELKCFHDLEERISALASPNERGEAFEVFAEAYLATLAIEKAKEVWPGSQVPHSLRKRLALPVEDKGVDGVLETQLGEYHAYQSKFRTGRPSLTWAELSTFIGLSDKVNRRVLVTNCDSFSDVLDARTGFYAITGNDFDKLEPQDFAVIRAWLEGSNIKRQPKTPLPHQVDALDDILSALREHNRATALMACGTGKTLVALWVAERMGVRNILVLVPSLALLRQTLHEWARETSWQSYAHLCVCSDPTVKPDSDELVVCPTDLDFPVTTDSTQVREFLAAKYDGVKLVFATYQSAHVVAAGMKKGDAFDLTIFDEAHKTAGREGSHFGFALKDENLSISKRLFLTATPRHYDVRKRDKEGDAKLIYSMDVPDIYGPVVHKLTFAEAARRGIICDYKVIISVVTSDMVNDHLLRHGDVMVKGEAVNARHVANQIALKAAVEKHGVRKIITFHRSVASAAAFSSDGSEGITTHLGSFHAGHVNGSMRTSERENIMTEFRAASEAVISNAKCLTEGVDVPAVDMVAFLTPKRSRVDIVQATGRAMRKAPGKTIGYVLVPLFVEQAKGETIEKALARTEFDEVWNVLQAMQEQDGMLTEVVRKMREERGRTKGFDDGHFRAKVEVLCPEISIEELRRWIATACIEYLASSWDERYGELKAFKSRFNHCDVAAAWAENLRLAKWVSHQRQLRKTGLLSETRIRLLDEIGFIWDAFGHTWEQKFMSLVEYNKQHGHCNVSTYDPKHENLGKWVGHQRRGRQLLDAERVRRLDEIGFVWDIFADLWEEMFADLSEFRRTHGHSNVPQEWAGNSRLGKWVSVQRKAWKIGQLNEDRTRRLEELGFDWDALEAAWEQHFQELVEYGHAHGHCDVPATRGHFHQLGLWVNRQRKMKSEGKLSNERIRRLQNEGVHWDTLDAAWEENLAALIEFSKSHGHCNVSARDGNALGTWVSRQRNSLKMGTLSTERIERLTVLGLAWDPLDVRWENNFALLVEYRHSHGDCNVPARWVKNPSLGTWVAAQRRRMKKAMLSDERIHRLNQIGFQWSTSREESG